MVLHFDAGLVATKKAFAVTPQHVPSRTARNAPIPHQGKRSIALIIRATRIWTGLYLLGFVTCHLINLSFGLVSISAMDAARPVLTEPWVGPVAGPIMTVVLLLHFLLGLYAIYQRPTLRTNTQDLVQLFSGVLVMPLLATHLIGVRMSHDFGFEINYAVLNHLFWVVDPRIGLIQVLTLTIVWIHGMAGLFVWMRSSDRMRHVLPWLYPMAVAIPVVALLGYAEAGYTVLEQARIAAEQVVDPVDAMDPVDGVDGATEPEAEFETEAATDAAPASPAIDAIDPVARIKATTNRVIWISIGLAGLALLAREIRVTVHRTRSVALVRGQLGAVSSTSQLTILDGLRHNHVAHAQLCAGRGRCGTCAVRVISSEFPLPEMTPLEVRTLKSVDAPDGARLACQCTPTGGRVVFEPLYPADFSFADKDVEDIAFVIDAEPDTQEAST